MTQTPEPQMNDQGPSWMQVLVILFVLVGLGLTVYFGMHLLRSTQQLRSTHPHAEMTDVEMIRSWMTIPYISRAYHVPESVLWEGLGISETGNRRKNIHMLEQQYGDAQPGVILGKIKMIVRDYQLQHPKTPTPPPLRSAHRIRMGL